SPLQKTPCARLYGTLTDRFGVPWANQVAMEQASNQSRRSSPGLASIPRISCSASVFRSNAASITGPRTEKKCTPPRAQRRAANRPCSEYVVAEIFRPLHMRDSTLLALAVSGEAALTADGVRIGM